MAVLGTLVDRVAGQSIGAGSWAAATYVPVAHSLATNPDFVFPILQSVGAASVMPQAGALRGNASQNTLAFFGPVANGASQPAVAVDVISWYVWSGAR